MRDKRVIIRQKEDCLFLIMNNKANSMSPSFIREIHSALSQVEEMQKEEQRYKTVVLTSTSKKIFSAGLDLKYIQKNSSHD